MEWLRIGRRDEMIRRDAVFHPSHQANNRIMLRIERHRNDSGLSEVVGARSAGTVIHPGHHEQAIKATHPLESAVRSNYSLEVVDRSPREDKLIAPAVISDHLSAALTKFEQIGIVRAGHLVEFLLRIPEPFREAGHIKCQSKPGFCSIQRRQ